MALSVIACGGISYTRSIGTTTTKDGAGELREVRNCDPENILEKVLKLQASANLSGEMIDMGKCQAEVLMFLEREGRSVITQRSNSGRENKPTGARRVLPQMYIYKKKN